MLVIEMEMNKHDSQKEQSSQSIGGRGSGSGVGWKCGGYVRGFPSVSVWRKSFFCAAELLPVVMGLWHCLAGSS